MVIFLVGLVSMILMRTLRKDYARYSKDEEMDDMERDLGDEYGWKQVHGDVFRPASHPMLFSAFIGAGYQVINILHIIVNLLLNKGDDTCNTTRLFISDNSCGLQRDNFRHSWRTLHRTRFHAVHCDFCLRCNFSYKRLRRRRFVREDGRSNLDQADAA